MQLEHWDTFCIFYLYFWEQVKVHKSHGTGSGGFHKGVGGFHLMGDPAFVTRPPGFLSTYPRSGHTHLSFATLGPS